MMCAQISPPVSGRQSQPNCRVVSGRADAPGAADQARTRKRDSQCTSPRVPMLMPGIAAKTYNCSRSTRRRRTGSPHRPSCRPDIAGRRPALEPAEIARQPKRPRATACCWSARVPNGRDVDRRDDCAPAAPELLETRIIIKARDHERPVRESTGVVEKNAGLDANGSRDAPAKGQCASATAGSHPPSRPCAPRYPIAST